MRWGGGGGVVRGFVIFKQCLNRLHVHVSVEMPSVKFQWLATRSQGWISKDDGSGHRLQELQDPEIPPVWMLEPSPMRSEMQGLPSWAS